MAMLISLLPRGWGEGHCSWVAKQLLFHEQEQTNLLLCTKHVPGKWVILVHVK